MTNNDILRRIRYTFDFNDKTMIKVFALADCEVTREQISAWLKQDEDPDFQECNDKLLATFLNGLIVHQRGKKEGPQPEPEKRLTNNIIFRKLKIALDLQAEDILQIMELTDFTISKHELSAFFRKPEHKHYRECKEQILRRFVTGMQIKYRKSGESAAAPETAQQVESVWNSKPRPVAKPESKAKPEAKLKNASKSALKSKPVYKAKPKAKAKAKPKLSLSKK